MPDITELPVMRAADATAIGFAQFNDVPHKVIDIPDGGFTLTTKTSDGNRVTFYFGPYETGGPPAFIDIQYRDLIWTVCADRKFVVGSVMDAHGRQ